MALIYLKISPKKYRDSNLETIVCKYNFDVSFKQWSSVYKEFIEYRSEGLIVALKTKLI